MTEMAEKPQPNAISRGLINKIGGMTRFVVLVPVLGLLASAIVLVVVGALETIHVIGYALAPAESGGATLKETLVAFIELADLYLLAVVIYIIALGLFELFISPDLELPGWLTFNDLDDLKYRLLGVVVVVLAVNFLGKAMQVQNAQDLLWTGIATAAVIASLAVFLRSGHAK